MSCRLSCPKHKTHHHLVKLKGQSPGPVLSTSTFAANFSASYNPTSLCLESCVMCKLQQNSTSSCSLSSFTPQILLQGQTNSEPQNVTKRYKMELEDVFKHVCHDTGDKAKTTSLHFTYWQKTVDEFIHVPH